MKLILSLVFCLTFCGLTNAQFEDKLIKNPKKEKLASFQNILKTDISVSNRVEASEISSDYKKYLNIDFNIEKNTHYQIIKEDSKSQTIWLRGYAETNKSSSYGDRAFQWLNGAYDHFELSLDEFGYKEINSWEDELNEFHMKLNQSYKGIPIYGAEFIIHSKEGRPFSMNGKLIRSFHTKDDKSNVLNENQIRELVKKKLKNYTEGALDFGNLKIAHEKSQWEIDLVYYPQNNSDYVLAYYVRVYPNQSEHLEYFLNANSGKVLDKYSTICKFHYHEESDKPCTKGNTKFNKYPSEIADKQWKDLNSLPIMDGPATSEADDLNGDMRLINTYEFDEVFFMIDASRDMFNSSQSVFPDDPQGVIWTIDLNNTSPVNENSTYTHVASASNNWNDRPEGVSAHYNGGSAYEYFRNTFNRNSITGNGQSILSFVNVVDEYENSMGNAFWNGIGIYYGNGDDFFNSLGRALDVAGHEMSHGVIESTANLEYRNESGAMNEAFADIFGAMIDRDDWTIGEDVVKLSAFPSGALRDLSNPHNDATTGDFLSGWQPMHYSERYVGPDDNGGVHWNSGIINHAFYLFAQSQSREIAEQVFYRALTTYLIRSSEFKELRFAVVQSAMDLFSSEVAMSARNAFDEVGILDESEPSVGEDYNTNPGTDLLLVSDQNLQNLYVFDLSTGAAIFDPLSSTELLSKPSITDDGSRIVFVGVDNHIHLIDIDWSVSPPTADEEIVSVSPDWRNAVISKDGRFIALLENIVDNKILVIDLLLDNFNEFVLSNPTYSSGISTGEVQYADVLEFDATSTSIIYDAYNVIDGNSGKLEFWDIGFVEVWNPQFDTWALGSIDKLFGSLPEGVNIGNPTFSKNSPYIIAIDIFNNFDFEILGINLESQESNSIYSNTGLSYPSFSRDDNFMVFDLELIGYTDLGILQLTSDKIGRVANSDQILLQGGKWGTWFSNGQRILSSSESFPELANTFTISPNPAIDFLYLDWDVNLEAGSKYYINIFSMRGEKLISRNVDNYDLDSYQISLSNLTSGMYIIQISDGDRSFSRKFVKK